MKSEPMPTEQNDQNRTEWRGTEFLSMSSDEDDSYSEFEYTQYDLELDQYANGEQQYSSENESITVVTDEAKAINDSPEIQGGAQDLPIAGVITCPSPLAVPESEVLQQGDAQNLDTSKGNIDIDVDSTIPKHDISDIDTSKFDGGNSRVQPDNPREIDRICEQRRAIEASKATRTISSTSEDSAIKPAMKIDEGENSRIQPDNPRKVDRICEQRRSTESSKTTRTISSTSEHSAIKPAMISDPADVTHVKPRIVAVQITENLKKGERSSTHSPAISRSFGNAWSDSKSKVRDEDFDRRNVDTYKRDAESFEGAARAKNLGGRGKSKSKVRAEDLDRRKNSVDTYKRDVESFEGAAHAENLDRRGNSFDTHGKDNRRVLEATRVEGPDRRRNSSDNNVQEIRRGSKSRNIEAGPRSGVYQKTPTTTKPTGPTNTGKHFRNSQAPRYKNDENFEEPGTQYDPSPPYRPSRSRGYDEDYDAQLSSAAPLGRVFYNHEEPRPSTAATSQRQFIRNDENTAIRQQRSIRGNTAPPEHRDRGVNQREGACSSPHGFRDREGSWCHAASPKSEAREPYHDRDDHRAPQHPESFGGSRDGYFRDIPHNQENQSRQGLNQNRPVGNVSRDVKSSRESQGNPQRMPLPLLDRGYPVEPYPVQPYPVPPYPVQPYPVQPYPLNRQSQWHASAPSAHIATAVNRRYQDQTQYVEFNTRSTRDDFYDPRIVSTSHAGSDRYRWRDSVHKEDEQCPQQRRWRDDRKYDTGTWNSDEYGDHTEESTGMGSIVGRRPDSTAFVPPQLAREAAARALELKSMVKDLDTLLVNQEIEKFGGLHKQILGVKEVLLEFTIVLKNPLALRSYDNRYTKSEVVDMLHHYLKHFDSSDFSVAIFQTWITRKAKELGIFSETLSDFASEVFLQNEDKFNRFVSGVSDTTPVLILTIGKSCRSSDSYIDSLRSFLNTFEPQRRFQEEGWYEDTLTESAFKNEVSKLKKFLTLNKNSLKFGIVTGEVKGCCMGAPGKILLCSSKGINPFYPPSAPDKPYIQDVSETAITVRWTQPAENDESIIGYIISHRRNSDESNLWIETRLDKVLSSMVEKLIENTEYVFKVAAVTKAGKGVESLESDPVKTRPPPPLALKVIPFCEDITESRDHLPGWFQLPLVETFLDKKNKLRRYEVNEKHVANRANKIMLLVGATGSGKTTLINGLVNYLYGVKHSDPFRLVLIKEDTQITQAYSQTNYITAYTINWHPGAVLPYSLTIVDTPGYGDTGGIDRDKEITKQIKHFFDMPGPHGISHLDGIGFVAQAPLARLTEPQKYVFDSVLSVFGKDVEQNIFLMITFADAHRPPLLEAMKEHKLPYQNYYKFNSSVFSQSTNLSVNLEPDSRDGEFESMFWNLALSSFENFFTDFLIVQPKSLVLTREVLKERESLEVIVEGLQVRITGGINQLSRIRQEVEFVQFLKAEVTANKSFRRRIEVPKTRRVEIATRGRYVTNCLHCSFTCHQNCFYANDDDKYNCSAMDGTGIDSAACRVCTSKCAWKMHVNRPFYFEDYIEEEWITLADIQKKYSASKDSLDNKMHLITAILNEYNIMQKEVLEDLENVRCCIEKLDEIAMKPNPLTTVDYIDLLIKSAQQEKKPGWEKRIDQLQDAREKAKMIEDMRKQGKHYDPFKELQKEIERFGVEQANAVCDGELPSVSSFFSRLMKGIFGSSGK